MMLSTALVPYPVHVVLLNSSAVYRWGLVENRLILVAFLPEKMDTCEDSELSGEVTGDCAHYWFTGTVGTEACEAVEHGLATRGYV